MRTLLAVLSLVVALPTTLVAQQSNDELRRQIQSAQAEDAAIGDLLQGANAARSLRDFQEAKTLLDRAGDQVGGVVNGFINTQILYELTSGGGVAGAQRRFHEISRNVVMDPVDVAGWVGTYPELLVGGGYDDAIEQLSAESSDPRYRCTCYSQKAWMYRVAGDMERSRIYWDSLAIQAGANPPQQETPVFRAQSVRNLARAGRTDQARQAMQRALSMDQIDQLPQAVQRNWAQAYVELGDVDAAVEILERLLEMPSQVTVASLGARVTWSPVRDDPAFQALLDRHR